jgi:hypothetical protein
VTDPHERQEEQMTTPPNTEAASPGGSASERLTRARGAVASAIDRAAEGLHDRAEHLPGVATATALAHGAATRLETTAEYVRDHGAREMADDVKEVIRNHPGKALLAAMVLGFVTARALRD